MRRALVPVLTALVLFVSAGAAGYFLSSSLGEGVVRHEIEQQLERLMLGEVRIERVKVRIDLGLVLEGWNVRVYPSPRGAGLEAPHVVAKVDVLSLLLGQLRLRQLILDGVRVRIERDASGAWSPYPVAALARRSAADRDDPEHNLGILRASEATARKLLEGAFVASLVEIHDGGVDFVDRWAAPDGTPIAWQLHDLNGSLDHRWLSRSPELVLRAVLRQGQGPPTRIEAEGRKLAGRTLRLMLAATGLDLHAFDGYAARLGPKADFGGDLSGVISFETSLKGSGVLELDWVVRDMLAAIPRHGAQVRIASPRSLVSARIEMHPGRLRLESVRVLGQAVEFSASGVIERPLRDSSRARLVADLRGASLPVVRHFLEALPPSDSRTLLAMFNRVESAKIAHLGGGGAARLSEWRQLLAGDLNVLPPGIIVAAEIEELAIGSGLHESLNPLGGRLEWSEDRLEVRDLRAAWNGEPLPALDVSIDGVSHLFASAPDPPPMPPVPENLPGLRVVADLMRDAAAEESAAEGPTIHLEIDRLALPGLRRPFERAIASVEPFETGVQIDIARSSWGPAQISGEFVWLNAPEPRISVSLRATPEGEPQAENAAPDPQPPPPRPQPESWLSGRFRLDPHRFGPVDLRDLRGELAVVGRRVRLSGVRGDVQPRGAVAFDMEVDLSHTDQLPGQISLRVEDWDVSRMVQLVGLEPEVASGRVHIAGELRGELWPGQPPLSHLTGSLTLRAENGKIRQKTPLIVAMAAATEGFNPFSKRNSVRYEAIDTVLAFDHGRISTPEFKLEGPMRIFASGSIDTSADPNTVDAVVGVFLFRQADLVLGKLPLVKELISDKGLIGAYYQLSGERDRPKVTALPGKTLAASIPDIVKAPFKVLRFLLTPHNRSEARQSTRSGEGR